MSKLVLFHKPYKVLSQFTDSEGRDTLKPYIPLKNIYAAGRLDYDSEGLLLLTDDGSLQQQLANPRHGKYKYYWVQVEGIPTDQALNDLRRGVKLKDGPTKPAQVERIDAPNLPPRNPPIRERANIPTCWLQIAISEGRNRQVRRMTAAIGHPTLRLVRYQVDQYQLKGLKPGEFKVIQVAKHKRPRPGQQSRGKDRKRAPKRSSRKF